MKYHSEIVKKCLLVRTRGVWCVVGVCKLQRCKNLKNEEEYLRADELGYENYETAYDRVGANDYR